MIRLDRLLSNLGYCSRREVKGFLKDFEVCVAGVPVLKPDTKVDPTLVTIDGAPLDPPTGMVLLLNKPCGYVCSHNDPGQLVYELLPERFTHRNPQISSVGRLDKETSGLLLLTDDGELIHRLTSPKKRVPKVYRADLLKELSGNEAGIFASGELLLEGDDKPLLPAELEVIGATQVRVTIFEGRYHQVRRMFSATGNEVISLHRERIGGLTLGDLPEGEHRVLSSEEVQLAFNPE